MSHKSRKLAASLKLLSFRSSSNFLIFFTPEVQRKLFFYFEAMEVDTRAELTATSVQTRNKKLSQVLANRDLFIGALRDLQNELGQNERSFQESQEVDMVSDFAFI